MKAKKKNLKKLKKSATCSLLALQPSDSSKAGFKASFLEFEDYCDLHYTVQSLINVCILATQGDHHTTPFVKDPGSHIRCTLELVSQLLPFEEWEYLDESYKLLVRKS
ncbi:hypothetical protein [Maribacter litoralis]|uniref:hypothetical protein n=1 Tax=Maribacter litoralis TaxID=2059726 RepID=UPI003F5CE0E0